MYKRRRDCIVLVGITRPKWTRTRGARKTGLAKRRQGSESFATGGGPISLFASLFKAPLSTAILRASSVLLRVRPSTSSECVNLKLTRPKSSPLFSSSQLTRNMLAPGRSIDEGLGAVKTTLSVPALSGESTSEPIKLGDFKPVASYSYLDSETPSLVVPGMLQVPF
jgi:hypothetical protein